MKGKAKGVFRRDDGTWTVDILVKLKGDRKRTHIRRTGFPSELAAEKAKAALIEERQRIFDGRYEEKGFSFLLDSFCAYERTRKRVSSYYTEKAVLKVHIEPRYAGKTIVQAFSDRSVGEFRRYVGGLDVKTQRRNRIMQSFGSLASFARSKGLMSEDALARVMDGLSPFRNDGEETKAEKTALTKEEYKSFIATFKDDDPYKCLFELWFFLGARCGEILGLRWSDFDERTKEVSIHQQRQWNPDAKGWEDVQTKTSSSRRHLKLSDFVFGELEDLRSSRPTKDEDYLFFAGAPISKKPLVYQLRTHCRKAGIPEISPHEIRHTVASWLVEASTDMSDLIAVSQWLGHSSTKETLDTYSHYLKKKSSIYNALDVH